MRVRAILTDLDGTLLEPDASVHASVPRVLARLEALGIPVCAVTSKTPAELELLSRELGLPGPASFENGAGVVTGDGRVTLGNDAVPVAALRHVLVGLRRLCSSPLRALQELDDAQLAAMTGLAGEALTAARRRVATMPLVVDPSWDDALRAALPADPAVRLVRGNRFLHLQGRHDKADAIPLLLAILPPGDGAVAALGDAPNDAGMLAAAGVRVIVPSVRGPHPDLVARFPDAVVAPHPHGRGWAAAVTALLGAVP